MERPRLVCFGCFVLAAVLLVAGQSEVLAQTIPRDLELVPGAYRLEWDPELVCTDFTKGVDYGGDDAKAKIRRLPEFASDKPLFCAKQLDGTDDNGYLVYAIDESGGPGTGFDTLFVDANRNRDLTDDTPIKFSTARDMGKLTGRWGPMVVWSNINSLPWQWVEVHSHQGPLSIYHHDFPAKIGFKAYIYDKGLRVEVSRAGAWRGTIDSNKGKIDCVVADGNANGIYGELSTAGSGGDRFYADLCLSGEFLRAPSSRNTYILEAREANPVPRRLYSIRASPTGEIVIVRRYAGPSGQLIASADKMKSIGASIWAITLSGRPGRYVFCDFDDSPLELPAGRYKITSCMLSFGQSDGHNMYVGCGSSLAVTIKDKRQTKVLLGGELRVEGISPEQKVLRLASGNTGWMTLHMGLGDNLEIGSIRSNRSDHKSDSFGASLLDKQGNVVQTSTSWFT